MTAKRVAKTGKPAREQAGRTEAGELVILTGMSGSGKESALKAFEDLGYYSVDNLPLELLPRFADLVSQSAEIQRAAMVVDVREGMRLERFPAILKQVSKALRTRVVFLDAQDALLVRRYSETRRPHPLGRTETVVHGIRAERQAAGPHPQCCRHRSSTPPSSTCMSCANTSTRSLSAERASAA